MSGKKITITPGKGTREEKRKHQSPNKRPHPKVQNTRWVANECVVHVDFVALTVPECFRQEMHT
jgi:hypothetical protein